MLKRIVCALLAVVLTVGLLPIAALAEETVPAPAEEVTEVTQPAEATEPAETQEATEAAEETEPAEAPEVTEAPAETEAAEVTEPTDAPEATEAPTEAIEDPAVQMEYGSISLKQDTEALYEAHLNHVFGLESNVAQPQLDNSTVARNNLNSLEKQIYDGLLAQFRKIANGERDNALLQDAVSTSRQATRDEISNAVNALVVDCPWEAYWLDHSYAWQWRVSSGVYYYTFFFGIAPPYNNGSTYALNISGTYYRYYVYANTTKTRAATSAAARAKSVVSQYAGYSDYEKLYAYATWMCREVSYNFDAVEDSNYSDRDFSPWMLIDVFDGDPSTNVVCQGYAMAFQYLWDLSTFNGDVTCYVVNGYSVFPNNAGAHRWNVVEINGKRYIVDVTNFDSDNNNYNHNFWMVGADYHNEDFEFPNSSVAPLYIYGYYSFYGNRYYHREIYVGRQFESCYDLNISRTDYDPYDNPTYARPTGVAIYTSEGKQVNGSTQSLLASQTLDLVAQVFPDAANQDVIWASSNTSVAKVNAYGTVTAVGAGTATITATSRDNTSLSARVTVKVQARANGITITKAGTAVNGCTVSMLQGTGFDLNANVLPSGANQTVVWASSDPSVVSVNSNGYVSGLGGGSAVITATTTDGTKLTARVYINVQVRATGMTITNNGKQVNGTTLSLLQGKGTTLVANVLPAEANQSVTWSSSDSSVAKVSSTGYVTAVKAGTVTISAKAADSNVTARVTVKVQPKANGMTITQASTAVNGRTLTLIQGKGFDLNANVLPAGALQSVTWSTSNTAVATVNQNGYVSARSAGTATITATTTDGTNLSARVFIKVQARANGMTITKNGTTVNGSTVNVTQGKGFDLNANVLPAGAIQTVTWASSNTAVAKVSSTGYVTAVAAGIVTITATTTDGTNLTARVSVNVQPKASGMTITSNGKQVNGTTVALLQGKGVSLTANVLPAGANQSVTWASGNTNVAKVSSSGYVTAVGVGTVTISATAIDTNVTARVTIKVQPKANGMTITKAGTAVNGRTITLVQGKGFDLNSNVLPSAANQNVTWATSDANIATVNQNGYVSGRKAGSVTISATTTDGTNITARVFIKVIPRATGMTITNNGKQVNGGCVNVALGKGFALTANVLPAGSTQSVTWASSDSSIAKVSSSGYVTAVKLGSVTISATTTDGTNLTARVTVNVLPRANGMTITKAGTAVNGRTLTLKRGSGFDLNANVLPIGALQAVVWSSSDTSVATVNQNGYVTGLKTGTVTIYATTTDGTTLTARVTIKVVS